MNSVVILSGAREAKPARCGGDLSSLCALVPRKLALIFHNSSSEDTPCTI